jgi:pimeloyl-ACP methyl ester carboxylesterase/DNA-binding CsgD family transcriptional regulator
MTDRQSVRFCASADGVRLAFAEVGRGAPLVKAANWLTHLEYDWRSPIWAPWVRSLSERYRYLRYDTRGCGLSDRDPADVSLEAWVRDLEAVVDAAKLDRFTLFGMSQGGAIAASYAVRHPERVERLVLLGVFARGRLQRDPSQARVDEELLHYKIAEMSWGSDNPSFRDFFASGFMPGASREMLQSFAELQRESSSAAFAVRQMQVSAQIDVSDVVREVRCPTLVMHARDDARVPIEEGRRFASLIPGARFVALESRNHVMLPGEPAYDVFLEELEHFVPSAPRAATPFAALTPRERELVELLARGLDNHQIAAHLGVVEKTVRNHLSAVLAKLGIDSRGRAIVLAREAGFGADSA